MTLYKAKIKESIDAYEGFYGMSFLGRYRGKIVYLSEDNGTYNNSLHGKSKYKGRRPSDNIGDIYYWIDTCFEWMEEII
jgi:hypothetical protein